MTRLVVEVLNPLDAVCNVQRMNAICINQLKYGQKTDADVLKERPDVKIFLPFKFHIYNVNELFTPGRYQRYMVASDGDHLISLIDGISYKSPSAPMISQLEDIPPETFCHGDNLPPNCTTDCTCTHKIDVPLNAIVEVVLVDEVQQANISHPFHMHGHSYYVIGVGRSPDKSVKKINLKHALELDRKGLLHRHFQLPPMKDTVAVPNNGYAVLRFRADNPGYWLFHCHFMFHIVIGMNVVLHVGTQADLPPIPESFPRCGHHLPPITKSVYPDF